MLDQQDKELPIETTKQTENYFIVNEIVIDLVLNVLDAVEIARITEVSCKLASRPLHAIASHTYWIQCHSLASRIFKHDLQHFFKQCYIILVSLCKVSWQTVRYVANIRYYS
jgi:hypothetical protein